MCPPNHTAPASSRAPSGLSIIELRAQILGNASVLRPKFNGDKPADYHLEAIVAKTTLASATYLPRNSELGPFSSPAPPMSEKAALYNSMIGPQQTGKYYGLVVVRTTNKRDVEVLLRGEPSGSTAEALELLLEQTEEMIDEKVAKHGKPADDTCCIM